MALPNGQPVELASHEDVTALHRLRRQLEDWLHSKGVRQWPRGFLSREKIAEQVTNQEWHLLRHPDVEIAAALRMVRSDPDIWGDDDTAAVYVHSLMVDRAMSGSGLGASMLDWVAQTGRRHGADVFRLDCAETNPVLRRFYGQQGFHEVGRRDVPGLFSMTLLEKPI